jgi:hypothetical protein
MAAFGSIASVQNSGTSVVVTKPSSLAAGDMLVAFLGAQGSNSATAWNTPSGWTSVGNLTAGSGSDRSSLHVFAKVADSGDAAASDFTFTRSNTVSFDVALYRVTGTFTSVAGNIPASTVNEGVSQGSNVFEFTGITQQAANSLLIMHATSLYSVIAGGSSSVSGYLLQTTNPTWTEQYEVSYNTPNTTAGSGSATATRTAATATGYFRVTFTVSTSVTEIVGALLEIADTANASPSLSSISLVASVPTMTPAADANVSAPAVISFAASVASVTPTTGEALWKNTDKPSPGSITNVDKP